MGEAKDEFYFQGFALEEQKRHLRGRVLKHIGNWKLELRRATRLESVAERATRKGKL